jgi:DNA-binding transcriptional ArsR family regulator
VWYSIHVRRRPTAEQFRALGDPTRLHIFEFLRACGTPLAIGKDGRASPAIGPTAGEVCCHITGEPTITSTISFHLKELRNAGLISTEKRGKNTVCSINRRAVETLAAFFDKEQKKCSDCC